MQGIEVRGPGFTSQRGSILILGFFSSLLVLKSTFLFMIAKICLQSKFVSIMDFLFCVRFISSDKLTEIIENQSSMTESRRKLTSYDIVIFVLFFYFGKKPKKFNFKLWTGKTQFLMYLKEYVSPFIYFIRLFAGSLESPYWLLTGAHSFLGQAFSSFMLIRTTWRFWTSWRHFGCTKWRSQHLNYVNDVIFFICLFISIKLSFKKRIGFIKQTPRTFTQCTLSIAPVEFFLMKMYSVEFYRILQYVINHWGMN